MSITKNNTHLFTGTGELKFSDLRVAFKETSSGSISAKELLRDTSINSLDPIVPNCTENNGISAANDLSILSFRNSIKYYNLDQSGTYINLDIDAQDWNSNLSKNIVKSFKITGTLGSNQAHLPAASLDYEARNLTIDVIGGKVYGAGGEGGPFVDQYALTQLRGEDGGTALYLNTTANDLWFTTDGSYNANRIPDTTNVRSFDAAGNVANKTFNVVNDGGSFSVTALQNSAGLSMGQKLYIRNSDLGGGPAPDIEITVAAVNVQWINVYTNSNAKIWGGGGGGGMGGTGQTGGTGGGTVNYPGGQGGAGGLGGKGGTGRGYNNSGSLSGSAGSAGASATDNNTKVWKDAKNSTLNDSSGNYWSGQFVDLSGRTSAKLRMKGSGWQSTWLEFWGGDERNNKGEAYKEVEVFDKNTTTRDSLFSRHEWNWGIISNSAAAPENIVDKGQSSQPGGQISYSHYIDMGWYYCGNENSSGNKDILWNFNDANEDLQTKDSNSWLCLRDDGGSDCNGRIYTKNRDHTFQSDGQNVTGHVPGLNWDTKTFTSGTGGDGGNGGDGGDGSDWGQNGAQGTLGLDGDDGNQSSTGFFLQTFGANTGNDTNVTINVSVDNNAKATDAYVHNRFTMTQDMGQAYAEIKVDCENINPNNNSSNYTRSDFGMTRLQVLQAPSGETTRWELGYDTPSVLKWYPNKDYLVRSFAQDGGSGQLRIRSGNNKVLEFDDNSAGTGDNDFNDLVLTTYQGYFKEIDDKIYWRYDSHHWAWGLYGFDTDSNVDINSWGDVSAPWMKNDGGNIERNLQPNSYHGPLWGETIYKASGPAKLSANNSTMYLADLRNQSRVMSFTVDTNWAKWVVGKISGSSATANNPVGELGGNSGNAIDGRYHQPTSNSNTSNNVIKGDMVNRQG